jgi:DNA-binding CsgD family transcriptional regulator
MGCFMSPAAALECSLALQESLIPLLSLYERSPKALKVGVSLGEPVQGLFGLFGGAMLAASTLCAAAAPGETRVSEEVYEVGVKAGFAFTPAGPLGNDSQAETPVPSYRLLGRVSGQPPDSARSEVSLAAGRLSERERTVLCLVARGRTNKEIAAELWLSMSTVATHMRHILEKTGSANRAEATAFAYRNRLVG